MAAVAAEVATAVEEVVGAGAADAEVDSTTRTVLLSAVVVVGRGLPPTPDGALLCSHMVPARS